MSNTKDILKKYTNYTPEVVTYDESVDGGTIPVREKHLKTKDELKKEFDKHLKKVSSGKCAR